MATANAAKAALAGRTAPQYIQIDNESERALNQGLVGSREFAAMPVSSGKQRIDFRCVDLESRRAMHESIVDGVFALIKDGMDWRAALNRMRRLLSEEVNKRYNALSEGVARGASKEEKQALERNLNRAQFARHLCDVISAAAGVINARARMRR